MLFVFMIYSCLDDSNLVEFNLEDLEIYQYNAMSFHKLSDGYLISSDFDNVLCRIKWNGHLVARYDQEGPGPNELNRQVVLHADDSEILVVTNHRHIISFNGNLEPMKSRFTPLPHGIWGGAKLGENHYLVLSSRSSSFAIKEFRYADKQWQTTKRSFAIHMDPQTMINTRFFRYQNGWGFFYDAAINTKDDYLIEVHDLRQKSSENIVQMLSAPIDDLPGREGSKVFLSSSYRYKDGFIAFLVVRTFPKYDFKAAWIDRFNAEGQFMKRYLMDKYTGIIPVQNGDELLEINQDTMMIRNLQLEP